MPNFWSPAGNIEKLKFIPFPYTSLFSLSFNLSIRIFRFKPRINSSGLVALQYAAACSEAGDKLPNAASGFPRLFEIQSQGAGCRTEVRKKIFEHEVLQYAEDLVHNHFLWVLQ